MGGADGGVARSERSVNEECLVVVGGRGCVRLVGVVSGGQGRLTLASRKKYAS